MSFTPLITVLRHMSAAHATALTPPRPSILALAPVTTRRWRSSSSGIAVEKNSVSFSSATSTTSPLHCASYLFVAPKVRRSGQRGGT